MYKKNILLICGTGMSSKKNGKTNEDLIKKAEKCLTKYDYIILSGSLNHRADENEVNKAKRDKTYREWYDLNKLMKQHSGKEWSEFKNKMILEKKARDTIGNFFYSYFLMKNQKEEKVDITEENLKVISSLKCGVNPFKKFFIAVIKNKKGWSWFYLRLISFGLMFKKDGEKRRNCLNKIRDSDKITKRLINDYTNKISQCKI